MPLQEQRIFYYVRQGGASPSWRCRGSDDLGVVRGKGDRRRKACAWVLAIGRSVGKESRPTPCEEIVAHGLHLDAFALPFFGGTQRGEM
jgi:hypothetical protein